MMPKWKPQNKQKQMSALLSKFLFKLFDVRIRAHSEFYCIEFLVNIVSSISSINMYDFSTIWRFVCRCSRYKCNAKFNIIHLQKISLPHCRKENSIAVDAVHWMFLAQFHLLHIIYVLTDCSAFNWKQMSNSFFVVWSVSLRLPFVFFFFRFVFLFLYFAAAAAVVVLYVLNSTWETFKYISANTFQSRCLALGV